MRLNKLVIKGFKSFADRTEIVFNDNYTAIVGPNGCGKSNVSDAIKWTLAESRPREVRSMGKMTDVIFKGTEKRPSMSYAEVSLYFDNTKKDLFKGLNYDEVVITRKIDKSGTSEYFINNMKCLQKDINAMLQNTGIGKNGYSIIHQGKVSEICRAKAQERRMLFEEAADISNYRTDKVQAEEKLKDTQYKLESMNEMILDYESRLEPLRKQAEKTRKSDELKAQIKEQEVNLFISKSDSMQETKQKFEKKINKATLEIVALDDEMNKISAQNDEYRNEINRLEKELTAVSTQITEVMVQNATDTGQINTLKQKMQDCNTNIERINSELEILNEKKEKLAKELEDKKTEFKLKNDELNSKSATYNEKNSKYEIIVKTSGERNSKLQQLHKEYIEAIEKKGKLDEELQGVKTTKAVNESKVNDLNNFLTENKEKFANLLVEIDTSDKEKKKYYNLKIDESNAYNQVEENRKKLKQEIEDLRNEIAELNNVMSSQRTKYEVLSDNKSRLSIFNEATRLLLQDKDLPQIKGKLFGTLVDLIKVPTKYSTAVEYSVGGAYQHVVVPTADDATFLINYLKEKKYGRVTFRPLSTTNVKAKSGEIIAAKKEYGVVGIASELVECDPKFRNLVEFLLGNTLIVDNAETGKQLFMQYRQAFKIATLDGDIFSRGGEITGGFNKSQASKIFSQQKEIDDAKKTIEQTKIALEESHNEIKRKQIEVNDLAAVLEERKNSMLSYREKELAAENTMTLLAQQKEELENIIQKAQEELSLLTYGAKDLQPKLEEQRRLEEFVIKKKLEYDEASKISADSQANDESAILETEVMNLKVETATLRQIVASLTQDLDRLDVENANIDKDINIRNDDLNNYKKIIEEVEEKTGNIKVVGGDRKIVEDLELQRKTIELRKEFVRGEMDKIQNRKDLIVDERSQLNENKYREETALDKYLEELNEMRTYIIDTYDLTYDGALQFKLEGFESYGAKERIKELKAKKSRLGDVNDLAILELAEVEAKYKDMSVKRDDVVAACNDIQSLIAELTAKMRNKFLESFNKIRENYQKTFEGLFLGGKGDLELDYSKTDDPLLADIIIKAKPPGKKEMDIGLYSGGEQTLISIALLFSFISLKPMPFCLLDEADAALDEPNGDLFAQFINKYAVSGSQFIVITHRRQAMQCANSIYGVTMQEKGVSKLVSIELEDAVKMTKEA